MQFHVIFSQSNLYWRRQRINGHRSNIKHNRNKPVAKHFNKSDHTLENLRLAVIKKAKGKTKQ